MADPQRQVRQITAIVGFGLGVCAVVAAGLAGAWWMVGIMIVGIVFVVVRLTLPNRQ